MRVGEQISVLTDLRYGMGEVTLPRPAVRCSIVGKLAFSQVKNSLDLAHQILRIP